MTLVFKLQEQLCNEVELQEVPIANIMQWYLITKLAVDLRSRVCNVDRLKIKKIIKEQDKSNLKYSSMVLEEKTLTEDVLHVLYCEIVSAINKLELGINPKSIIKKYLPSEYFLNVYNKKKNKNNNHLTMEIINMLADNNVCDAFNDTDGLSPTTQSLNKKSSKSYKIVVDEDMRRKAQEEWGVESDPLPLPDIFFD